MPINVPIHSPTINLSLDMRRLTPPLVSVVLAGALELSAAAEKVVIRATTTTRMQICMRNSLVNSISDQL